MTDQLKPPIITPIEAAEDALEHDDDTDLPEHERRDAAIGRAPDTLEGQAQGPKADDDEDDPLQAPADPDEVVPTSHLPG
jgi:hypothetical protein